jgi:RNA polymerase sigma factor (sigma-70 family)
MRDRRLDTEQDLGLVEKSLEGSGKAFRSLVERYHSLVYSVVRSIMGNCDDAEDVTQEVFIKIYRKLSTFRGESKLSTWIYRIARNEAINAAARTRVPLQPLDDTREPISTHDGPAEHLDRRITATVIEKLLAGLDERYRMAIELRYMSEKSYAEIAEIMDIPIGSVKTYIYRAKATLKRKLELAGYGNSGAG